MSETAAPVPPPAAMQNKAEKKPNKISKFFKRDGKAKDKEAKEHPQEERHPEVKEKKRLFRSKSRDREPAEQQPESPEAPKEEVKEKKGFFRSKSRDKVAKSAASPPTTPPAGLPTTPPAWPATPPAAAWPNTPPAGPPTNPPAWPNTPPAGVPRKGESAPHSRFPQPGGKQAMVRPPAFQAAARPVRPHCGRQGCMASALENRAFCSMHACPCGRHRPGNVPLCTECTRQSDSHQIAKPHANRCRFTACPAFVTGAAYCPMHTCRCGGPRPSAIPLCDACVMRAKHASNGAPMPNGQAHPSIHGEPSSSGQFPKSASGPVQAPSAGQFPRSASGPVQVSATYCRHGGCTHAAVGDTPFCGIHTCACGGEKASQAVLCPACEASAQQVCSAASSPRDRGEKIQETKSPKCGHVGCGKYVEGASLYCGQHLCACGRYKATDVCPQCAEPSVIAAPVTPKCGHSNCFEPVHGKSYCPTHACHCGGEKPSNSAMCASCSEISLTVGDYAPGADTASIPDPTPHYIELPPAPVYVAPAEYVPDQIKGAAWMGGAAAPALAELPVPAYVPPVEYTLPETLPVADPQQAEVSHYIQAPALQSAPVGYTLAETLPVTEPPLPEAIAPVYVDERGLVNVPVEEIEDLSNAGQCSHVGCPHPTSAASPLCALHTCPCGRDKSSKANLCSLCAAVQALPAVPQIRTEASPIPQIPHCQRPGCTHLPYGDAHYCGLHLCPCGHAKSSQASHCETCVPRAAPESAPVQVPHCQHVNCYNSVLPTSMFCRLHTCACGADKPSAAVQCATCMQENEIEESNRDLGNQGAGQYCNHAGCDCLVDGTPFCMIHTCQCGADKSSRDEQCAECAQRGLLYLRQTPQFPDAWSAAPSNLSYLSSNWPMSNPLPSISSWTLSSNASTAWSNASSSMLPTWQSAGQAMSLSPWAPSSDFSHLSPAMNSQFALRHYA